MNEPGPLSAPSDFGRWLLMGIAKAVVVAVCLIGFVVAWDLAPQWMKNADALKAKVQEARIGLENARAELGDQSADTPPQIWRPIQRLRYKAYVAAKERFEKVTADAAKNWPFVVRQAVEKSWRKVALIVGVVLLGPFVWRVFAFWVLVPVARVAFRPVELVRKDACGDGVEATLVEQGKSADLGFDDGDSYALRSGLISSRTGVKTSWMLYARTNAPLICGAAKLWNVTVVGRRTGDEAGHVALTTGDPDQQISFLELKEHPGFVVRPGCILGVSGGISIRTLWRFGVHNWLNGQIRYVLMSGTGRVVLGGRGGLRGGMPQSSGMRVEYHYLAGYDGRLTTRAGRTENFPPYFLGQTELLDQEFEGDGLVLQERSIPTASGNVVRGFLNGILQGLGKFLGF